MSLCLGLGQYVGKTLSSLVNFHICFQYLVWLSETLGTIFLLELLPAYNVSFLSNIPRSETGKSAFTFRWVYDSTNILGQKWTDPCELPLLDFWRWPSLCKGRRAAETNRDKFPAINYGDKHRSCAVPRTTFHLKICDKNAVVFRCISLYSTLFLYIPPFFFVPPCIHPSII